MKAAYFIPAILILAACETTPEPMVSTSGATDATTAATAPKAAEPDCDEKAKQKVEISETEVKLGGGDTGCKLE